MGFWSEVQSTNLYKLLLEKKARAQSKNLCKGEEKTRGCSKPYSSCIFCPVFTDVLGGASGGDGVDGKAIMEPLIPL